ncbi:MAG TPA: response regulator transcription factor [Terracidiphilus sp.]|jgi:DNA-binding NarL/FixJ family response regulator
MPNEISIVLADDHPVVRKGLKLSIEADSKLTVVAEAGDGEAALALIKDLKPQVAILDIDMPKLSGLDVARQVANLGLTTKLIFLSFHRDEDFFREALEIGGKGYLLKDGATDEIVTAVHTVVAGQVYMSSAITLQLLHGNGAARGAKEDDSLIGDLTPSERRILLLIADGLSSKEIGNELSIHYRTVENHRTNICRKLGIEGANALLRFAVQHKGNFR